jgi:predicted double-glycine peptidase
MGQEYVSLKVVPFIEAIGYRLRVPNYYVINEDDGYINVSYYMYKDKEIIDFHKNYYYGSFDKKNKNELSYSFDNFTDFEKFMTTYHKKQIRKIKINRLNGKS